jgi:hypothetical protein
MRSIEGIIALNERWYQRHIGEKDETLLRQYEQQCTVPTADELEALYDRAE